MSVTASYSVEFKKDSNLSLTLTMKVYEWEAFRRNLPDMGSDPANELAAVIGYLLDEYAKAASQSFSCGRYFNRPQEERK